MGDSPLKTAKQQRGRPFPKGKSGNPGGRPKKTPELIEIEALCKEASPRAVERLKEWLESDNAKASVSAANGLLDRGFGKPKQALIGGGENDPPIRAITEIRRTIVDPGQKGS